MIKTRCNFINSLLKRVHSQFGLMSDTFDVYINIQRLFNDDDILYTVSFETQDLLLITNFEESKEIQVMICSKKTPEYLAIDNYFNCQNDAIKYVLNELELIISKPISILAALFDANYKDEA